MRLRSEFWVKAFLRRAAVGDCPGAVIRHGDDDAGAIFIRIATLDGSALLFGPAPAGFDGADVERRFVPMLKGRKVPEPEIDAHMEREIRFDSDLWLVEIESRAGQHFLDGWLLATPE